MAARYLRKQTWWVRFYHPLTRALVRESLGTADEARAELLRQRIELEAELLQPRFQVAEVPPNVRAFLNPTAPEPVAGTVTPAPAPLPSTPILPAPPIDIVADDQASRVVVP